MSDSYRVHYKKGDTEVEVESSDKSYVDAMLAKLITATRGSPHGPGKSRTRQRGASATKVRKTIK